MEATNTAPEVFSKRPASLFPAGLKVARGSLRERLAMLLLLVLDSLCWAGLYMGLSELSGDFNRYGWSEVILPTAICVFASASSGLTTLARI